MAAAAGALQAHIVPRLSGARDWLSHQRDLGFRYLAENTAISGASQLRVYGVGIILGLAAVGYVQVAGMVMGPFLVIFMGISLVVVPEAARILRNSPRHLRLFCLLVGGGLATMALLWGGALLVLLPTGLGDRLLGPIWRPSYDLILPVTIQVVGACLSCGATAGLHALGAARRSLRAQIMTSSLFVLGGLAGALVYGTIGTMWATAAATMIGAVLWWWQLRLAMQESSSIPAGYGLGSRRPPPRHRQPARAGRRQRPDAGLGGQANRGQPLPPLRPGESESA